METAYPHGQVPVGHTRRGTRVPLIALLIVIIIILLVVIGYAYRDKLSFKSNTAYQAVFLTNGQVYFESSVMPTARTPRSLTFIICKLTSNFSQDKIRHRVQPRRNFLWSNLETSCTVRLML